MAVVTRPAPLHGGLRVADDVAELRCQHGISRIILGGHDWAAQSFTMSRRVVPAQLVAHLFSICTPFLPPSPTYKPLELAVTTRLPNFGCQIHFATGELDTAVQFKARSVNFSPI